MTEAVTVYSVALQYRHRTDPRIVVPMAAAVTVPGDDPIGCADVVYALAERQVDETWAGRVPDGYGGRECYEQVDGRSVVDTVIRITPPSPDPCETTSTPDHGPPSD